MGLNPSTTAAFAAAALAAACAAEKPADDIAAAVSERKPGAAVEISAVQRAAVDPGEIGVVEFTFAESYAGGSMTVTASGSEGLEILPPAPKATMAMGDKRDHKWDVSFRAAAPGVYYVDLLITAADGGAPETRSYSARVAVGASSSSAKPADQSTTIDGEPVVIMDAAETVDDQ